jgi:undecaprenyl diphosphate synthase
VNAIPRHIAFIMDGNGRWAEAQGMPRIEGHRRGAETVRIVTETCAALGVEAITLYCLSSENWKRPSSELEFLMALLEQYLVQQRGTLAEQNIRLEVIGRRDRLPPTVLQEMERTLAGSAQHTGMRLVLAIDYGGRAEILAATRSIAAQVANGTLSLEEIDEDLFRQQLYLPDLPDPDLLIRTGGEQRISNYLLWQISYTELWVTPRCWPEFTAADCQQAIADFGARQRRFGGLANDKY